MPFKSSAASLHIGAAVLMLAFSNIRCGVAADATASTNGTGDNLQEIVVTAQKRAERLQDVPIAISVLSGTILDQSSATGIGDALSTLPGVAITSANGGELGGGMQIAIRGVSAGGAVFSGASPIAYYLDGLPFGLVKSAAVPDTSAYDLDRVEVLRGPQGTLYGANAEDGVVRILTNDADLDNFDFKARTSLSTTDNGAGSYRGDLAVNIPIVDGKVAARIVVGDESIGGWINNPLKPNVNNGDRSTVRFKLDAKPTDALSIDLSAWHQQDYYGGPGLSYPNFTVPAEDPEPTQVVFNTFGAKIGYQFPTFSVTSSTSYLNYKSDNTLDLYPLLPSLFTESDSQYYTDFSASTFSEEFLLNSQLTGPWRWTAGVAFRNSTDTSYQQNYVIFNPSYDSEDHSKSIAVFGELSRRFLDDKLELTLGGRYFHDDVSTGYGGGSAGGLPAPISDAFHATTPRVVLTWFPKDDLTVYGSYSQGFRSGFGQDYTAVSADPTLGPVLPDKLYNYELGTKGSVMDQRLSFDIALFYVRWEHVQQSIGIVYDGVCCISGFVNGTSASGPGVDISLLAHPLAGLDLGVNLSWNGLEMDQPLFSGGELLFARGQRLNYSPEYTVGPLVKYSFGIGSSGFSGYASASANYTSEQIFANGGAPPTSGNSVWIIRSNIGVASPNNHWKLSFFGDNLNNSRSVIVPDPTQFNELPRPRTVGAQLEYHLR